MIRTVLFVGAVMALASPALAAPGHGLGPDGKLSLDQFEARQWRHLAAADTDHDGRISKAEFVAFISARHGAERAERMFARLDVDHDGFITEAEVARTSSRRFARLDGDRDGFVTSDEMMAARQARAGARQ